MYKALEIFLSKDKDIEPLISLNSAGIKFRENISFSFKYLPWNAIEKVYLSQSLCLNVQGSRYIPRPAVILKLTMAAAQTSKNYGNLKYYDEGGYQICGYLDKKSLKELRGILKGKKASWKIEIETTEKIYLNA